MFLGCVALECGERCYRSTAMQPLPGIEDVHGLASSRRHAAMRSTSSALARAAYVSISRSVRRRASGSEAGPMYRSIFLTLAARPWKHQKYRYRFPRISFSTKPQPTFMEDATGRHGVGGHEVIAVLSCLP